MSSDVLKTNRRFLLFCLFIGVFFAFCLFPAKPASAATGINQEVNFQGRLLNSQGATVPDGYYNIEFKIYQDGDGLSVGDTTGSPAGSLKWTEDYLNNNTQGVKVVNGYLSVELGSINPFGSSINWNQNTLWLSMNIGNTNATCSPFSSCSPDGEMTPMQPLTTAVYALNANELGGVTASSFGQLANNQTWTGTNVIQPTTNITGLEVQQTSASSPTADIFDVQGAGGSADNLIQVTSTAANQGAVNITALGSSNAVTITSGSTQLVINNTASAFTGNVTTTGTLNSQTISATASFTGTLNVATGYKVGGVAATTGNYLRGNGTNFVSSAIQAGDLPSLTGTYLRNVPAATGDNTVAPTLASVVGLTVTGTTGTAATAVNIIQGGAAADLTLSNTASTSGNIVSLTQSSVTYTGTALLLNLAAGSGSFTGNFLDLQKNSTSQFKVDNAGNVTAGSYDASSASTLNIGTTTATNITIGQAVSTSTVTVNDALTVTGVQPAAVGGAGTAATTVLTVTGGQGGNTSGTANIAGAGAGFNLQGGVGGNATAGSGTSTAGAGGSFTLQAGNGGVNSFSSATNGNGGSITLSAGAVGTGGTGGSNGSVIVKNQANSTTAFQVQNTSGNSVLTIDTSGNSGNGQAILGSSSNLQGTLTFANTAGTNTITLAAPTSNPASSYTLNLPTSTPSAGLCLETSTSSANQLVFTACSNANASITYLTNWNAYSSGSAITTINDSPTNIGDLLVLATKIPNNSSTGVTSISGGGVTTWMKVKTSPPAGSYNRVEQWMGTVTSTGSSTITLVYNSGSGNGNEINVSEYTAAGVSASTSWGVDISGVLASSSNVTSITWPTLTSQNADEAYIGYAQSQNGASNTGCTSAFTCLITANSNALLYNTSTSANTAYSPSTTQTSGEYNSVGAIFIANVDSTAINNSISTQQANFNVQAGTSGTVAGVLEAASSGSGDILDLLNGSGTKVATISSTGAALFENSTNSTIAFQIQNSSNISLFNIDSTDSIVQVGSSVANGNGIILVLNNYNGGSPPTEVDGGIYYDNASSQFLCGEAGYWVACGSSPANHSYDLYDEFMYGNGSTAALCTTPSGDFANASVGIGQLNWTNSLIGAPTTLTYCYNTTGGNSPAASSDRPGILDIDQTGSGNSTGETMSLGTGSMLLGTSKIDVTTAVNITGGNLTTLWGLDNETTATTAPTTGIYWKEANNGTWQYCYVNATPAETCANSAATATAGSWFRLEIDIVSSSEIDFFVNGTKTAVTGITYNTTNRVAPAYTTYKTTGVGNTLDLYIDYFELRGITSTAR